MTEEFNLSNKEDRFSNTYKSKDIKEFIKHIKQLINCQIDETGLVSIRKVQEIIDEFAGEKLI